MKYYIYTFVAALLIYAPQAHATESYTVENVKMYLKGVNPVEARESALKAAEVKAFKALFKSLNEGSDLSFDEAQIPSLITDYELVDEQIAPDRYAATYTFRFDKIASQEMARTAQYEAGIKITNTVESGHTSAIPNDTSPSPQSPQYSEIYAAGAPGFENVAKTPLLLPYWKKAGQVILWGQGNNWRQTWERMEGAAARENAFTLPIGDLSDMRITSGKLPEGQDDINQLMARYQTNKIIVAVGERAISSVTTTLYKADESGLSFWKVVDSPVGPASDPYSVAAGQIMAEIRANFSAPASAALPVNHVVSPVQDPRPYQSAYTAPAPEKPFFTPRASEAATQGQVISATSSFKNARQWQKISRLLNPKNGIEMVRIRSLKPRSVKTELQLGTSLMRVQQNLARHGISLNTDNAGGYILSLND